MNCTAIQHIEYWMLHMTELKTIIKALIEKNPALLNLISDALLTNEGREAIQTEDTYFAEQIAKHTTVLDGISDADIKKRMYDALTHCRIDDFLFFYRYLKPEIDYKKIQTGYNELARKGYVGGIEAILKETGVPVILVDQAVAQGYNALIATGRIEAIDYLRQLSGAPPSFSNSAVQAGYLSLFWGQKFTVMNSVRRLTGIKPLIPTDQLDDSINQAIQQLNYEEAAALVHCTESDFCLSEEKTREGIIDVISSGKITQLPYLLQISKQQCLKKLPAETIKAMLDSENPVCLEFIYGHQEFHKYQVQYAQQAYNAAVNAGNLRLFILACQSGEFNVSPDETERFMNLALTESNTDAVEFLAQSGVSINPRPEVVQLFLYRTDAKKRVKYTGLLGVEYSPIVGEFVGRLQNGDFSCAQKLYESSQDIRNSISWAQDIYKILGRMNGE
jgi:hypothetical protein